MQKEYHFDVFSKLDIYHLNRVFSNSSEDFFLIRDRYNRRRSSIFSFSWMSKDKINPINIKVCRFKDDYYFAGISQIRDSKYFNGKKKSLIGVIKLLH